MLPCTIIVFRMLIQSFLSYYAISRPLILLVFYLAKKILYATTGHDEATSNITYEHSQQPKNWSQMNGLDYWPNRFKYAQSPLGLSLAQINCSAVLNNPKDYIKSRPLLTYMDTDDLKTDCDSINKYNYFAEKPNSEEEANFPIAFARNVFKDYAFLEMELSTEYAPQNFYCYTIDSKASMVFKNRMRDLAKCFPNVFIAEKEFDTNSNGSNNINALFECYKLLSAYSWKYVIALQNHDIVLRTNYELVQIFKWFNGADDILVLDLAHNYYRINLGLNWTFAGLNLFRNASKNWLSNGTSPTVSFAYGYFQQSMSRAMVDFMLNQLDMTKFLAQLEGRYGIDEIPIPTLFVSEEIKGPNGFTHACIDRKIKIPFVTRYSIWDDVKELKGKCMSGIWRHSLCMFGMGDLYLLARVPKLFANKMMPESDFGAILCWYEYMFNRSHLEPPTANHLNKDYYLSMPHIRYQNEKERNGFVNLTNFDCNFKYDTCEWKLNCM